VANKSTDRKTEQVNHLRHFGFSGFDGRILVWGPS